MHALLSQLQAALTGARLSNANLAALAVTGFTTDSRKVVQGNLFLALRGERFDAHDFLSDVAALGAAAVVVDHVPEGLNVPAIIVPDTKVALAEIGRFWRRQFTLPVIGVTGSNGKTTVKEMISSILAAYVGAENRLATTGNLNNDIGVPLTVLRLTEQHRAAVVELGMNHPGEIALISSVAEPTVGLVNNAQREHQEFMQSVQAVAEENGAVIRGLADNGTAVFPIDDEYTSLWQSYAKAKGHRRIVTFGLNPAANVSATYQANIFGSDLSVNIDGNTFQVELSAAGEHNVRNALAAAACAYAIGVPNQVIAAGLKAFAPVNGRLQRKQASNGATVIDDTYNANPDSVRAAIDVLAQSGTAQKATILVLGDMGEVGNEGPAFHQEIGAYAKQRGIQRLYTLGELAQFAASAYGQGAEHFSDLNDLLQSLDRTLAGTETALIKGSRFMKMERVVDHLTQSSQQNKTIHTGTH